jgi:hypothetical protein
MTYTNTGQKSHFPVLLNEKLFLATVFEFACILTALIFNTKEPLFLLIHPLNSANASLRSHYASP